MDDDFLDEDEIGPDDIFEVPRDKEDELVMIIYELAVRNFLATFSPECSEAKSENERMEIKDRLLQELAVQERNYQFSKDIPSDVYSLKDAKVVFEENIKRNEDGEYSGLNKELMHVATKITIELYEKTCMRMVDRGELQLVYDEELQDFAFRPTHNAPKNDINKSSKPRRKKKC